MNRIKNPTGEPRFYYGYLIVVAAFLIMLLTYGVRTSFGVFFKPMSAEFEWSRALTSGAVTLSMLVQGIWGILMGKISDKIGSRWVITWCCFFLGLGLFMLSFTHHLWELYLYYGIFVGVGMGGVFVALVSAVAHWFEKQRGVMTGVVLAGIGIGTLSMAPLTNWLIDAFGWRQAYTGIAILVLVPGIICAQILRKKEAAAGLMIRGQAVKTVNNHTPVKGGFSLKQALGSSQFWLVGISFASLGYCVFTITVHLVPHITDLGYSPAAGAIVLALTGGIQSLGGILLGVVADKTGSKKVIVLSFILVALAILGLVPSYSLLLIVVCAIIYSFGFGGGTAMESTIVAELFGLKEHGVILGVISFGFTIGGALGPVVTGYLFDLTGSYQIGFLLCAALAAIGLVLSWMLKPSVK